MATQWLEAFAVLAGLSALVALAGLSANATMDRDGPFVVENRVRPLTAAAAAVIFAATGVSARERGRRNAPVAGRLLYVSGPSDRLQEAKD